MEHSLGQVFEKDDVPGSDADTNLYLLPDGKDLELTVVCVDEELIFCKC